MEVSTTQTFLPLADFRLTAKALDRQRLGKQRVENLQLLYTMTGYRYVTKLQWQDPLRGLVTKMLDPDMCYIEKFEPVAWTNHPAKKMWVGHEWHLREYHRAICLEWTERGYKDNCLQRFQDVWELVFVDEPDDPPSWLGNAMFHLSHQSQLLAKDRDHYLPLFPGAPEGMKAIWPVS